MDKINHDVITNIINKNINLFVFMNLDTKYLKDDVIFTEKYFSALKRAHKRNSIKYHPDKYINASEIEKTELENNFNLNQIIYIILSSQDTYNQYKECEKLLSIKSHDSLKSSFEKGNVLSNNEIQKLIKESTGGKSYQELAAEKDRLHGVDKTFNTKNVSKLYETLLTERDSVYKDIVKNTKKIDISDDKFENTFNKQFDGSFKKQEITSSMEIQAYNSVSTALTSNSFDYQNFNYSDLYASDGNNYEELFKLLSSNIPTKYEETKTLDEKIKEYEQFTKKIESMILEKSPNPRQN